MSKADETNPIQELVMRPGAGWTHVGGPVWEHANKTRVHIGGLVRLPDMTFASDSKWPGSRTAAQLRRINGGNRKRGLMAWAMTLQSSGSVRQLSSYSTTPIPAAQRPY